MSKYRRQRFGGAGVCAALAILAAPAAANAFELRHTSGGLPVRWPESNVSFVVDASVNAAASGGAQAVADAMRAWSGNSSAPVLSTTQGKGATKPAVDGQNTVLFAPGGYGPAGSALAITVLSYDDKTGNVVDADIVINGEHAFAVLASATRAPAGTAPVSTEGGSGDDDDDGAHGHAPAFDLQHVVSHELGHALGLGDVRDDTSALMYAYTLPDDASLRAPSSDDLAGVDQLYVSSGTSPSQSSGCGGASVAAARISPDESWASVGLLLGAGAWFASRRRIRLLLPGGAVFVALLANPTSARSDTPSGLARVDATARVVSVTTTSTGGLFETTLELAPHSCRAGACPERVYAHAWGGTVGGITQVVGDHPAPRADDEVDLGFAESTESGTLAAILAVRPLTDN